jgi:hypothetical protein
VAVTRSANAWVTGDSGRPAATMNATVKVAVGRNGTPTRPASEIIDSGRMASPSPARTSDAWTEVSGTSMPIDRSTPALANSWSAIVRVPHPGV